MVQQVTVGELHQHFTDNKYMDYCCDTVGSLIATTSRHLAYCITMLAHQREQWLLEAMFTMLLT
eukprot:9268-Heterococcus_DN1.PRE.1